MFLIALSLAGTIIAFLMIFDGLRRHMIDDYPSCAACGYDLRGRPPDGPRCSECGALLSEPKAIIVGHFRSSLPQAAAGFVIASVMMSLLFGAVRSQWNSWDLTAWTPSWVFQQRLNDSNPTVRSQARNELLRRLRAGKLSRGRIDSIAAQTLRMQLQPTYNPAWGDMMIAAHEAKMIDPPAWSTFIRQGLSPTILTRPTIHAGDPVLIIVQFGPVKLGGGPIHRTLDLGSIAFGPRTVSPQDHIRGVPITGLPSVSPHRQAAVDGRITAGLSPGSYVMAVTLVEQVAPDSPPPAGAGAQLELAVPVKINPPNEPIPLFVTPEELRPVMDVAASVRSLVTTGSQTVLHLDIATLPMPLASKVWIRLADGREAEMGLVNVSTTTSIRLLGREPIPPGLPVDVILRPDPELVKLSLDTTPRWGGEIVIRNVPVRPTPTRGRVGAGR